MQLVRLRDYEMNYPTTFSQQELLLVDDHVQTIAKHFLKWAEREIDGHLDRTIDGKKQES